MPSLLTVPASFHLFKHTFKSSHFLKFWELEEMWRMLLQFAKTVEVQESDIWLTKQFALHRGRPTPRKLKRRNLERSVAAFSTIQRAYGECCQHGGRKRWRKNKIPADILYVTEPGSTRSQQTPGNLTRTTTLSFPGGEGSTICEIKDTFQQFLNRDKNDIVPINLYMAEMCSIHTVLEILSQEHPYDAAKDSILCRAGGMFIAKDLPHGPPHSHAASPQACHQPFSKLLISISVK
ncbi:hypothetical protein GH733_003263 [Mirounga leonina]|nr:hypothetical protein GH733_003263 [Mirounga leonina]